MFRHVALSLPTFVHCPGRITGALVGCSGQCQPRYAGPILSPISGYIYPSLFSLDFYASITGKVKNASACGPALLNFRCSPDVQQGGLCNNDRIWAAFLRFPLTKFSSFEATLIHSPSWEGDDWGRRGSLRPLYQCGRTPRTCTRQAMQKTNNVTGWDSTVGLQS